MNLGRSIKNVGSRVTSSAMAKAEKVAIGAGRERASDPIPMVRSVKRQIHRGSSAGLRNEKNVHLNMEGTGYLNPMNQTARNLKRVNVNPTIDVKTSVGFSARNRTLDNRVLGSSCGSIKMLRERL